MSTLDPGPDDRPDPSGRLDNGLQAPTYVPLTDVEPAVGRHLLTALGRARIAAYLGADGAGERRRLFVASEERVDARTIVAAAVRALEADVEQPSPTEPAPDPLAGIDTDREFEALVADWHVDTHVAIRRAERDLTREDEDWRANLEKPAATDEDEWLDDDHYVPPPPPPLPRLAGATILAITIMAVSIVLLGFGAELGLAGNVAFVLGIVGLLSGGGILLTRVRTTRGDEDDDGAAV
ncbi:hypothetical protein [Jatrophihabitans fulvus]